ncbi:MAG: phosphate regulon sensor histidine kinase PhoR [Gammaproteobacteria bacterium]|nr:phosphate regulon sensor histidine kinase PhoR [Gammaproteobacteria bacterium]NND55607.1 phosphate regulon sensor histidine kinase PhoR [Gammaproteobacteria bacterium]
MGSWPSVFLRLALLAAAGTIIGALYGQPLIGLLLAVVAALAWNLMWLYRFDKWLSGRKIEFMPEGEGVWARVFSRVDFLRQRGKRRGKRFKSLLKQLRQATRSFPDAGIILNSRNEIVVFNRAARDLLGLKKQDRGLRIENLIRDPDFIAYLRTDEPQRPVEIVSPQHSDRWVACNIVPYGFDQKMLLVRDITERHRMEEMRRDFVANASHELRTPLTVITGYLDTLADDPGVGDELRPPLREMQGQANRMRQLVDELLRLSELESASEMANGTPVNIRAVIDTARQEARAMEGCPAQVEAVFDSEADLRGDVRDVQSVVSNLVTNAVRYTPPDGRIEVRWWTTNNGAFVSVTDNGVGIAREHLPRLCERFYRVENGRERIGGEGGTGLGLAIVKHALARHGANLQIESEQGKGSVFTCRFPPARIVTVA